MAPPVGSQLPSGLHANRLTAAVAVRVCARSGAGRMHRVSTSVVVEHVPDFRTRWWQAARRRRSARGTRVMRGWQVGASVCMQISQGDWLAVDGCSHLLRSSREEPAHPPPILWPIGPGPCFSKGIQSSGSLRTAVCALPLFATRSSARCPCLPIATKRTLLRYP